VWPGITFFPFECFSSLPCRLSSGSWFQKQGIQIQSMTCRDDLATTRFAFPSLLPLFLFFFFSLSFLAFLSSPSPAGASPRSG